jgi:hypothetical protein
VADCYLQRFGHQLGPLIVLFGLAHSATPAALSVLPPTAFAPTACAQCVCGPPFLGAPCLRQRARSEEWPLKSDVCELYSLPIWVLVWLVPGLVQRRLQLLFRAWLELMEVL